jgi:hypothetical protein
MIGGMCWVNVEHITDLGIHLSIHTEFLETGCKQIETPKHYNSNKNSSIVA